MSSAVNKPISSPPEYPSRLRAVRFLRAIILVLSGFAIAFSAPLHSQLEFDRWVLVVSLALIGGATLAEYAVLRSTQASWLIAVRAGAAFAAAAAALVVSGTTSVAILIAAWAAINAVVAIVRMVRGSQARSVALPSAVFSAALTAVLLIVRDDPVAIIGFFGAYAIIRGVFLGIMAFDSQCGEAVTERSPSLDGRTTAV